MMKLTMVRMKVFKDNENNNNEKSDDEDDEQQR